MIMKVNKGSRNAIFVSLVICVLSEIIGPIEFTIFGMPIIIMTLILAILFEILCSSDLIGKIIPSFKKIIGKDEIDVAPELLALTLYPLGIMFGISAGPKVGIVLNAGPALLLQELGNIMTMLIALPLGIMMGLGRTSVGATFSLCRDTALGIIGDKYGLDSREGMGTLGTYISGSV